MTDAEADKIAAELLSRLEAELWKTIAGSPPQPNETYMLRYHGGKFESTPVDTVERCPQCQHCGPFVLCAKHWVCT